MLSTPKSRGELFLASSLRDGLEDNDLRQVETLLSIKDADPNVLIPNRGISPFHLVIGNESEEFAERVSKLFLRHGGDPNVRSDDGMTPVHVAAAWGRVRVLELLLANGGDPLCLDDEARSPFHYAFDGAYYDVIALLGKYCANNYTDENDAEETPKYKLKLDKILVNKGNVIAEYVPSDNFSKSSMKLEARDERLNKKCQNSNSEDGERSVSRSPENSNRSCNNVTVRHCHSDQSTPLFPVYSASDQSFDEEKLLVGNIICRLSNSLADETTSTNDGQTYIKKRLIASGDGAIRLKKTSRHKFKGDTSIISKSPNCKLFTINDKTSNKNTMANTPSCLRKNDSIQKINNRPKMRQKLGECGVKSGASSTPKSKGRTRVCLHELPQILDTKYISSMQGARKTTLQISDRFTGAEINLSISPDTEFLPRSRVIEKNKAKNLAVRLVDRMYDEYHQEESITLYENKEDKNDDLLESPGSSNPLTIYSLEQKINSTMDENQVAEQAKILLEIDQAYKDKCPTPPASISFLETPEDFYKTEIAHSDYSSGESSSFWEYHEAEPRKISLWPHTESFVSVDEEYTYEDKEEGVAFIERHLRVIPPSLQEKMNQTKEESSWIDRLGELSFDTRDYSEGSRTLSGIVRTGITDVRELRDRLQALGEIPGPITRTTFNVYLKRLWRLERGRVKDEKKTRYNGESPESKIEECACTVPKYLLVVDWTSREDYYRNLEEVAFKEYSVVNPKRKYRGGVSKSSFCYLLLDPRLTQDLPRCGTDLKIEERWRRFLKAVFYVGKGKAARPAAHLYDAFNIWSSGKQDSEIGRKIGRILEIWQSGQGVVCLHVFYHTMAEEACSREASMIEALGTNHLTNCVHGTYYGYAATSMSHEEKKSLGKFLLYRAMHILMHEGERQLFPRNVIL